MEASDKLLSDLAMDARKKMDEARQGVDALASTMSGMIGGALLALAVLIPLTFFSVRSITQSIWGKRVNWLSASRVVTFA